MWLLTARLAHPRRSRRCRSSLILFFGKRLPDKGGSEIGIAAVGICFVLALGIGVGWIQRVNHPPDGRARHRGGTPPATRATAPRAAPPPTRRRRRGRRARPRRRRRGGAPRGRRRWSREATWFDARAAPRGRQGRHARRRPRRDDAVRRHARSRCSCTSTPPTTSPATGATPTTSPSSACSPRRCCCFVLAAEHAADDRRLGAGRPLLVRAHRPLVGGEAELRRRAQGVPHQPRRRHRPAHRHDHPVLRRRPHASTSSRSTRWPTPARSATCCCWSASLLPDRPRSCRSRASSSCTPGCPTPWPARRPVSALIHAATMVVAGIYMIARLYGVFCDGLSIGDVEHQPAWPSIGAVTARRSARCWPSCRTTSRRCSPTRRSASSATW